MKFNVGDGVKIRESKEIIFGAGRVGIIQGSIPGTQSSLYAVSLINDIVSYRLYSADCLLHLHKRKQKIRLP
jgi:hypothetical protein